MPADALVSVIIPVYNGARFIGRTLASASAQTYRPLEIVVVDDGSTDQSASIIRAAATRDERISLFQTQNHGIAAARNFGISHATGGLIAMLDGDDLWHPQKIAQQVEVLKAASSQVGVVYCWSVEIDEDDIVIPSLKILSKRSRTSVQGVVTPDLARGCFIETGSCPLIRRGKLEEVGGFDADLRPQGADDWKLYFALSEICEFSLVSRYLVGYRQVRGSVSRNLETMSQSMNEVATWIFRRRSDLADTMEAETRCGINAFMADRALQNGQFRKAAAFQWAAYPTCRARALDRETAKFIVRALALRVGIRRSRLRKRGLIRQVKFTELDSALGCC